MIAKLLVALGTVGASVGFMFIGIGQATPDDLEWMTSSGVVLLVGGIVVAILGALWYRSGEKAAEALIAARADRNGKPEARQAG